MSGKLLRLEHLSKVRHKADVFQGPFPGNFYQDSYNRN